MTGSIILNMAFGYSVKLGPKRDELLTVVEEATHSFIISTAAGAFLADVFPFCTSLRRPNDLPLTFGRYVSARYVPAWFPGTAWKQKVREWTEITRKMHDLPYEYAETKAVSVRP